MAATKRNAGLTSAVPRATLNDEELVCRFSCVHQTVRFGNVLCQIVITPCSPKKNTPKVGTWSKFHATDSTI